MTKPHMHLVEAELMHSGLWPISGTDEAGRGPLAGPVYAATVILNPHRMPVGLADSKKCSARQRLALREEIIDKAVAVGIGRAEVEEIDAINILRATRIAMRRSFEALGRTPAHAIIDGTDIPAGLGFPAQALINGDGLSASCAAASIVAKVARDEMMAELGAAYPSYGFERNSGYGTSAHLAALKLYGPCRYHRASFAPIAKLIREGGRDRGREYRKDAQGCEASGP